MRSYSLEDIEKLAVDVGMRTCVFNDRVNIFLDNFRVGAFKKKYENVPLYELLWTYTKVIEYHSYFDRRIGIDGIVGGVRFYGNLHTVYENMSKKHKELLKTIKAAEIKNCGGEYVVG